MNVVNNFIFILTFLVAGLGICTGTSAQTATNESVMLVLGSANPETLEYRVEVATDLYYTDVPFERIIVSGGCGAHASSICEASNMDSLLVRAGIPQEKIFKEEKSKSTKQNLCYSRKLTHEGTPLIDETDNLYVVSDHWHAIPVAGCFRQAGAVNRGIFHIEGTIEPKGPVDYTSIFNDCTEDNYCKSMLWAFVDAAYFDSVHNKIYYFVDDIYYRETPGEGMDAGFPKKISQYPGWPENWEFHLDAAYYNPEQKKVYLFNGDRFVSHLPGEATNQSPRHIAGQFEGWPNEWGEGHLDAAYYDSRQNTVYMFKGSGYLAFSAPDKPEPIQKTYSKDWPFQWGTGDIDAAYYHTVDSEIYFFRGTEFLKVTGDRAIDPAFPKAISLPWPESIW